MPTSIDNHPDPVHHAFRELVGDLLHETFCFYWPYCFGFSKGQSGVVKLPNRIVITLYILIHIVLCLFPILLSPCSYSLLWIVLLDTRWTLWSTTAWGYLWCSVITDYTHTVSVVPCVVEQSDLVMFYEGRSAITADCQLMGNFPLKPIFLQLDWFITI